MHTRSSVAAKAAPADNAASKNRCLSFERGGLADARPSGRRRRSAVQGAASQRHALTKDGAAAPVARRSDAVAYWSMVERTSSGALSRRLSEDLSPRAVFAISAAAAATSSSDADGDRPPMSITRLANGLPRNVSVRAQTCALTDRG